MNYDEIALVCEKLDYRDKLRLSQLLIQLARKEEENQNPQVRTATKENKANNNVTEGKNEVNSLQYVIDRLLKLRPAKKKTLLNSIKAMYQFQGGVSEKDQEVIIKKLVKKRIIQIDNNRVTYLNN
ncbi:MAG: hypothetical protein D3910_05830 [Candidatus Electrothrix sp. ATG2]|nr:hypothetical protein [Candidatus Electrothrix sp. ATG2]